MVPFLTDLDTPWREPRQDRSRERVAAILGAARELIAGGGLAALKMVPLARRAGVPVGTIYQFFADKDAIIGRIFASQLEADLQDIDQACNPGRDLESPAAAATAVVSSKYREWRSDPVMAEIWSIAQANRTLRALAMEASKATADIEVRALKGYLRPGVGEDRLWRACFVAGDLYASAVRTAVDLPADEAPALLEEYAAMVNQHIASLLC
jgi:AcrR family transcriptional regulator